MRWKSPSQRVQTILVSPLLIITAPVWLSLVAILWVSEFLERFGPKPEWKPWFAWRPVRFNEWVGDYDDWYGKWVWLERIERNRERGIYGYRPILTEAA